MSVYPRGGLRQEGSESVWHRGHSWGGGLLHPASLRHLSGPQFPRLSRRDVLRTLVSPWEASSVLSLHFAQLGSWANLEANAKLNGRRQSFLTPQSPYPRAHSRPCGLNSHHHLSLPHPRQGHQEFREKVCACACACVGVAQWVSVYLLHMKTGSVPGITLTRYGGIHV